jgi:hypothetical protein
MPHWLSQGEPLAPVLLLHALEFSLLDESGMAKGSEVLDSRADAASAANRLQVLQ